MRTMFVLVVLVISISIIGCGGGGSNPSSTVEILAIEKNSNPELIVNAPILINGKQVATGRYYGEFTVGTALTVKFEETSGYVSPNPETIQYIVAIDPNTNIIKGEYEKLPSHPH